MHGTSTFARVKLDQLVVRRLLAANAARLRCEAPCRGFRDHHRQAFSTETSSKSRERCLQSALATTLRLQAQDKAGLPRTGSEQNSPLLEIGRASCRERVGQYV